MSLLKDGGYFSFIMPNKFTQTKYGESIKKTILENYTIEQFIDFGELLKLGKAHDGNGKSVPQKKLNAILAGISVMQSRKGQAEWLDAYFTGNGDSLQMNYSHRITNGELQPQISEPLEPCIMDDDEMVVLADCNRQGLPTKKGEGVMYTKPEDGGVAMIVTIADMVLYDCRKRPRVATGSTAVRPVREK